MRKTTPWAGAALLAVHLLGCGGSEETTEAAPLRPVRTAPAAAATTQAQTVIAGITQASIESRISFRVGGNVERIGVNVGDRVRRGDFIAALDAADLEIGVGQAEASLAQVQALLRQARADFERVRGLYENSNASKSDLDAARAAAESGRAQVNAATRQLEQAHRQLSYARLTAPANGAIVQVDTEVNETVQAGQTIVVLASVTQPEVVLGVSEVNIPFLAVGDAVEVLIDAASDQRLAGTVTEVGVAASPGSATFPATVRLDDPPTTVRSGMAAEIFLLLDNATAGVFVPRVAVGEDREGRFVYTVDEAGDGTATVHRRAVAVGEPEANGIRITEGLRIGELVVTAGVQRLTEGMQVRLQPGAGE